MPCLRDDVDDGNSEQRVPIHAVDKLVHVCRASLGSTQDVPAKLLFSWLKMYAILFRIQETIDLESLEAAHRTKLTKWVDLRKRQDH